MYPYHGDLATPGGLAASTFLSACQIKYNKEKSDVLMATSCHSYELFMLWFCHCKYWKDPNRTDCALFLEDRHPSFYHLPERPVVREATFSTHPTFSAVSFDNSWLWQKVIATDTTQHIITWEERTDDVTLLLSPRQQLIASRTIEKWKK